MTNFVMTLPLFSLATGMPANVAMKWIGAYGEATVAAELFTAQRAAMFIAHCRHETMNFQRFEESFDYSPKGLMATWPSRFDSELAHQLGRTDGKPADQRAIANHAYNGRMGNRLNSFDGWMYRGRGWIQLTGRAGYTRYSDSRGVDIVNDPALVTRIPSLCVDTAAFFWSNNGMNEFADAQDILGATKRINGGTHGLNERTKFYHHALTVLRT